jgi:hypothetical protein
VQQHIEWNPTRQLWETEQADLFSEQQEPFSETWPTSGMTRNGRLLPLPTSAHPTAESVCSSSQLLPTPTTCAYKPTNSPSDDNRHSPGLGQVSYHFSAMLPTPRATDGTKGGPNQRGSSGDLMLPSAVMDM